MNTRYSLDMELLQTLVAIADTGSFAAAAEAVNRSQSAVSMQMKRLEDALEQPLFEKLGRRAVLTSKGQNLLIHARRMLQLQHEALAEFREPEMHGEVCVGVCDDYVMGLMPAILAEFAREYPGVHISLRANSSENLLQQTQRGELDFSLINLVRDDIEHRLLFADPIVWVCASGYSLCHLAPLPLAAESNCKWYVWARQALDAAALPYRIAYTTYSFSGVMAIVEAGLAVSVMARSAVPAHLRILGETDGMPPLPMSSVGLVSSPTEGTLISKRLADLIHKRLSLNPASPGLTC